MQVKLKDITKKFGSFTAVNTFSVTLEDGEMICLLGPSGCGKSTILNMLSGILPVTSGEIWFDDDNVTKEPPEERGIGLVFQNYALYPHMTVLENICFPLEIKKVPKAERIERATAMAKIVHVASSSASPSPEPWSSSPAYCCWTSPFPTWTPACASKCARRSAASSWRLGSQPFSSPTTRKRPWPFPTTSC